MNRADLIVAGVVMLVTAASWSASIAYDTGQREADSFTAGQQWAKQHQAGIADCDSEVLRISGPKIIGGAWLDGCLVGLVAAR